jgi:putative exporter of polyketide antibiotics
MRLHRENIIDKNISSCILKNVFLPIFLLFERLPGAEKV